MFTCSSLLTAITAETGSVVLQIPNLYQIVFVFVVLFTSSFKGEPYRIPVYTPNNPHAHMIKLQTEALPVNSYAVIYMVHIRDRNYISGLRVSEGWGK